MQLAVSYSGTIAQTRESEINRNIMSYHRIEVSLRRDHSVRVFNASLLTLSGVGTPRAHVLVKVGSFLSTGVEKRTNTSVTDTELRRVMIPRTGMPRQLVVGFGELPPDGLVLNGDSHLTLLLTNYPICMPTETLILRVRLK